MNKITLASLCAVVLFAFACRPPCHIDLEKPSDIKPIDWDAYNDVYDVFWYYFEEYYRGARDQTGCVKIYGKIDTSTIDYSHFFTLVSEHENEHNIIYDFMYGYNLYPGPAINVFCYSITDELREKLSSCDLEDMCYIKGELNISTVGGRGGIEGPDYCNFAYPRVHLNNIDDIYFETDNENDDE